MSVANWKQIRLFVEGGDDLTFVKRVLEPRLKERYDHVQIHTHANTSDDDLKRHFSSLERIGSDFFLLVDYDIGPCIAGVRQRYAQRYKPHLGEMRVLVVRPMIEAWYVAGVPSGNPFKASIPPKVDSVDKQAFAQIFGKRAESRVERRVLLQQILAIYDWDLYQSPSQSSQIPARAESPHSLPSSPLSRGERVGVRGDSSPVHSRTLVAQLVLALQRSASLRYCALRLGIAE